MADRGGKEQDKIGTDADPTVLGSYKILRLLGEGGFARVYLGEHKLLDTVAAIKVLRLKVVQSLRQDFYDEAHTIAHLQHNHIVRVLDFDLQDEIPFLVMDYAQNGSLRQRHPVGSTLSLLDILSYVRQVASALHYAHSQNVVHCDVKPENLLVGAQQSILLSDFGLATVAQYRRTQDQYGVAGTPIYMAPEQIQGKAQLATDQYALAVLVYEWLCGKPPFTGSRNEIIKQHLYQPPTPLRARGIEVSEGVEKVVLRALAKNPAQRFADILAFADALEEACQEERISLEVLPRRTPDRKTYNGTPPTSGAAISTTSLPHNPAPVFPEPYPPVWNVPYRPNPFFTGREEIIEYLHNVFSSATGHMTAQALTGLGGIGKTQAAIEYAYRYRSQYQAVFWATADTHAHLVADFAAIAALLDLPEQHEADEGHSVQAVMRWLQQQSNWLLILDNVDEPDMVEHFIPAAHRGHILLTTRTQATGMLAESLEIKKMTMEESTLFLLRRTGLLKPVPQHISDRERTLAMNIAQEMDGLPLALEQAGAYLEETACCFAEYLEMYRQRRSMLLQLPAQSDSSGLPGLPGLPAPAHPNTVATTWSLSFEQVEHVNLAAAELLRLCAFLHAEAIPEEIFTTGASELGPILSSIAADRLLFNAAIKELRKYSLIRRENTTLSIHRLVQAVLKDRMDAETQRMWSERAVRAVNAVFPAEESKQWRQCERYLPHAQVCAELIAQWDMAFPQAMHLLDRAGAYCCERSQYFEAKALFTLALETRQRHLGPEHPDVAISLHALGQLYHELSEYALAEQALSKAISLREHALGSVHPDLAQSLNLLAMIYKYRGEYARAEEHYQRALHILEAACGPDHADVAATLNNLARLYEAEGKYLLAEPLYARTLDICEREFGHDDPRTALLLTNIARLSYLSGKYARAESLLTEARAAGEQVQDTDNPDLAYNFAILGQVYQTEGKYQEAEKLFKLALKLREKVAGAAHPAVAQSLCLLASLYLTLGNYTEAEQLLNRALPVHEQRLGPEHANTAGNLYLLGKLHKMLAHFDTAESLLNRALSIREQALGAQHPDVAQTLDALAQLSLAEGKYDLISSYAQQALHIREQALGPDHPDVAESLLTLAQLCLVEGRYAPAHTLCQRALSIQQRVLGDEHPDVAQSFNILASLFLAQEETDQAEQVCLKAIAIRETFLGHTHPLLAQSLNTLAEISHNQGKYTLARSLCLEALSICENLFGSEHPGVAQSLSNLAEAYRFLGSDEAEPFYQRAIEIWERTVGREHPDMANTLNNLAQFYEGKRDYKRAEILYRRALSIYRHIKWQAHPDMAVVLDNYAHLLKEMGQETKAAQLEVQVRKIQERQARQNRAKT